MCLGHAGISLDGVLFAFFLLSLNLYRLFPSPCIQSQQWPQNQKVSCSRLNLGDLTPVVSQDKPSISLATSYCHALLKKLSAWGWFCSPWEGKFPLCISMKGIQSAFPAPRLFFLWLSFSFWTSYICISLSPLKHLLSACGRVLCWGMYWVAHLAPGLV